MVNASDKNIGTVSSALYEQCAVITNLVESIDAAGGSCDNTPGLYHGDIKIDLTASMERGKLYDVEVEVINEFDLQEIAFAERGISFFNDDIYRASGIFYSLPSRGRYQVNLKVVNARTGSTVCAAQSPVTSAL